MTETVGAALRRAAAALTQAGIEGAPHEARLLLAHALGVGPDALVDRAREIEAPSLDSLLARRARREPVAYITGRQGFWTLDLEVNRATLIPRADSETLIEAALAARPDRLSVRRVLDLGTGTGCLLLAALAEYRTAYGVGLDRSPAALAVARANAGTAGMADRAGFVLADWTAPLAGVFDLVLANPPYIPSGDVPGLMPEVSGHEPRAALDGGPDGLDCYRAILAGLPGLLDDPARAVLEVGEGQSGALAGLAAGAGLRVLDERLDLGGIVRAVVLGKKPFGTTPTGR